MKRLIGILIAIVALSGLVCYVWITKTQESANSIATLTRLEKKHIPSDEFFMQRAFPDAAFSIKTYTEALKSVKNNICLLYTSDAADE